MQNSILLPICGQVFLTFVVWILMYFVRIGAIKRSGIDTQELANENRALEILKGAVNSSDNFENLFEMPVLFYVAMLVLYVTKLTDQTYVFAAWTFVIFRALHSFIHCAYNRVVHRFSAYIIASVILWAIWARVTFQLATS